MEALVVALSAAALCWALHAHSKQQTKLIQEAKAARDSYAGALAGAAKDNVKHMELHEELLKTVEILGKLSGDNTARIRDHEKRILALDRPWGTD